jgi:arabinogalactan endo-1,4-beta-galactosidase
MLGQNPLRLLCVAVLANAATAAASLGQSKFYKGHDLSSLKLLEDAGAVYKDTMQHNRTRPVEDILGDGGMNGVRLR